MLPALFMGLSQARSFSASWGVLTECLGYLVQLFAFLNQPADENNPASQVAMFHYLPALHDLFVSSKLALRSGVGKTYDAFGEMSRGSWTQVSVHGTAPRWSPMACRKSLD